MTWCCTQYVASLLRTGTSTNSMGIWCDKGVIIAEITLRVVCYVSYETCKTFEGYNLTVFSPPVLPFIYLCVKQKTIQMPPNRFVNK